MFEIKENEILQELIEKNKKNELNYIEEAKAYFSVLKKCNITQVVLASKIGKSQSTIANKMRLLRLSQRVRDVLIRNKLTERHARAILKLRDDYLQLKALSVICREKLNVKESEELICKMVRKYIRKDNSAEYKDGIKVSRKKTIKDIRNFVKSVKKAITVMKKAGVKVMASQEDKGQYIEFVIRVPKKTDILT